MWILFYWKINLLQIAATGNNYVCFTYGEQKFADPFAGERYPSMFENFLSMGRYNATSAKYQLYGNCSMNYIDLYDEVSFDKKNSK